MTRKSLTMTFALSKFIVKALSQEKTASLDVFPLCPKWLPLERAIIYFNCRLAVSDRYTLVLFKAQLI